MTSSTGCSGFTRFGSPPSRAMPSRIAARSTTAGTPVKSCSSTRAGANEISRCRPDVEIPARQRFDVGLLDEAAVLLPQQVLQQDFHRIRQAGDFGKSGSLQSGQAVDLDVAAGSPPTLRAVRAPKLFTVDIGGNPSEKRPSYHVKSLGLGVGS